MLQFDWTTFILEILNFLVLVWILQKLIYKPTLKLLDARQRKIFEQTQQTEQLKTEAAALRVKYETALLNWEQEQETRRQQLLADLAERRKLGMEEITLALAAEEAKLRTRNQLLNASIESKQLQEAKRAAYQQTADMLKRLASPNLTATIVAIFLEDLRNLPETQLIILRNAAQTPTADCQNSVLSAHDLSASQQNSISLSLSQATAQPLTMSFHTDPSLLAGIRVLIGDCQLHVNLADELAFFSQQSRT